MVKKEDCTQSNDSNSSLSSNSSSSSSFVNNSQVNTDKTSSMQNLANQLVAAAVGNGNSILCAAPSGQSEVAQVYFQNDLANPYKLQAAAVHLINQAAQQHQTSGSKDTAREKRSDNRLANNISSSSSSGSNNGNEIVEVAQETNRKREIRLLKNREAARECRRKKKEYIKCLENRVAVLETQNKTLIEELKTLKELYCQTGENTNSNKNSSNSHSNSSSSQQSAASSKA